METALAIYEALIQANVPPPAARRVAESLEKDMTSNLATKQDLQHFDQLMTTRLEAMQDQMDRRFTALQDQMDRRFTALQDQMGHRFTALQDQMDRRFTALLGQTDSRFTALQGQTDSRFEAVDGRFSEFESRIALMIQSRDTRLLARLGALMTVLVGLTSTVVALLR
jgi:DNA anti-recombination protein RmuC